MPVELYQARIGYIKSKSKEGKRQTNLSLAFTETRMTNTPVFWSRLQNRPSVRRNQSMGL